MINIRKLERELWESADLLRSGSKLTSNQYCMPVLGLLFLRYAYNRFKVVEAEIMKNRPVRGGRSLPVEPDDFKTKNALYLPPEARYDYLTQLPDSADIGAAVNNAMKLIESQSAQLKGILPDTYTDFRGDLLRELLRIFNNQTLSEVGGDVIGRIYEYFLSKFAPFVASDDGVFFTPKSLVKMIVNVLEPTRGILLDPACGSGGMFVQSGDFIENGGGNANSAMTFYGQEKVEYNAKLCLMNMAVHGLAGNIKSGDEANTFYNDAHNLDGSCDYVMANPPFNVDKVKSESTLNAGRLPFGLPGTNKSDEVSNANYLWIQYFYSYLNATGRAGFVMASSATDSRETEIRKGLLENKAVDVILSVSTNFFYTKSLPCTLWFFDRAKKAEIQDKVLFIDARNYYTVVDRTLNEWSEWQLRNLNAIVWLYRGEREKYAALKEQYKDSVTSLCAELIKKMDKFAGQTGKYAKPLTERENELKGQLASAKTLSQLYPLAESLNGYLSALSAQMKALVEHGKSLKKDEAKAFAKELDTLAVSWTSYKRNIEYAAAELEENVKTAITTLNEAKWLTDKFGAGDYADVPGLCRVANISDVEEKNYSLTPGAYVGIAAAADEDEKDFAQRMAEIHSELIELQLESDALMEKITRNFEGLN